MKNLQEFQSAAKAAGLRGKIWIESGGRYLGFHIGPLTLSMRNGQNDMMEAAYFGEHDLNVAASPCSKSRANAIHRGRGYFIKDVP